MTPQQRAEDIARKMGYPGDGELIEAIRVAQIENANIEMEKRREAEALIKRLKRCTYCINDPLEMEGDKDCLCGGSRSRVEQLKGMNACIQYWRKQHEELQSLVAQLRQELGAAQRG